MAVAGRQEQCGENLLHGPLLNEVEPTLLYGTLKQTKW